MLCYDDSVLVEQAGKDVDAGTCGRDDWRTDKDAAQGRVTEHGYGKVGFKAINLASVCVSLHDDIHNIQGWLVGQPPFCDGACHQDCAGACAPDGQVVPGALLDGFEQLIFCHEFANGGAFSPWDNQPVYVIKVGWEPDLAGWYSNAVEECFVFMKAALQGEDPNCHLPPSPGQELVLGNLAYFDANHGVAKPFAHLRNNFRVVVVGCGFDDSPRTPLRVA